jgi:dUTPase
MIDLKVAPEVIAQRAEQRRLRDREWALKNKDKKAMHKRAYRAKKKGVETSKVGTVIKSAYRPNWKEAPVYECTELNYRGKQTS